MRSNNPIVNSTLNSSYTGPLFKCPRCQCGATGNPYDGFCRKCGYVLSKDQMLKRAEELIVRELRRSTPRPIYGLAYIKGIGRIDLEIGKKGAFPGYDGGSGLSKLLVKHKRDISHLGCTLVLGKTASMDEESKIARIKGDRFAILGKRPKGASVITHYKDAEKAASFESRR